jgi:hypothetical protein
VRALLLQIAGEHGEGEKVELLQVDADRALFRLRVRAEGRDAASTLRLAVFAALAREGVALGRLPLREAPS